MSPLARIVAWLAAVALAAAATPALVAGGPPTSLVQREDVDLANCASFVDGKRLETTRATVLGVLGRGPLERPWRTGRDVQTPRQYRIAFNRPLAAGALQVVANATAAYILKADAPYPGVPDNPAHWQALSSPLRHGGGAWYTLPPKTSVRAILLSGGPTRGWSEATSIRLFQQRLYDLASRASAFAESERISFHAARPPITYYAWRPIRGAGPWENIGVDKKGVIVRAPISEVQPSWYMLSWPREHRITGLWIRGTLQKVELRYFVGAPGINPRVGTKREWKRQRNIRRVRRGDVAWLWFDPITTRGLELRILKSGDSRGRTPAAVARIEAIQVFTDLGDAPPPLPPTDNAVSAPAPVSIPYAIDAPKAIVTMAVDHPDGTRARNLFARRPRASGQHRAAWDLKDEPSQVVAPGTYTWKAIYHPPLELRYEMTPYPNVVDNSPENSPWLCGRDGPGGWLADHSSNRAIAAAGDRVYMGAPVAESGVSLIETDLTGRKLWGYHSFASFTGVWHLAADERTIFVAARARNMASKSDIDPRSEPVWAIDRETKRNRTVAILAPRANRDRGMVGMAARQGKLYISVRAPQNYLANAAGADDVDLPNSFPKYAVKRKERYNHEIVPDPRSDFLRLLRLKGRPPGYKDIGLTYLESGQGPEARQYIVVAFRQPVPIGSVALPVPRDDKRVLRLSVLKPGAPYPPNPEDQSQWIDFESHGELPWDIAVAPKNTVTRAFRVSFIQGEDDIFTDLLSEGDLMKMPSWKGQVEGMKLLRRRLRNLMSAAKVHVSSGRIGANGTWYAKQKQPLTELTPAVYALEWPQPVKLRGLAIKEIDGELTRIEVFRGPADAPLDIAAGAGWEEVGVYRQSRRDLHSGFASYNGDARYLDGYVDFGREVTTRALRLRVVKQWSDNGVRRADFGDRVGRFEMQLDPRRCHVYGVAPLAYLGGEPPVDSLIAERVEVLDGATGKVIEEMPVSQAGDIAVGPDGGIFVVAANRVVRLQRGGKPRVVISDLLEAGPLAVDRLGNIYVYDGGDARQNVRVYDASGQHQRTVGHAGGHRVGPWDPAAMQAVSDIAVDAKDALWIVESTYWPKRVAKFDAAGEFSREFLGNTAYGGGGVLDPWDKRRLFYGPLEFELDWETGRTRLKNLTVAGHDGWNAGQIPIRLNGRTYMVTRTSSARATQQCGIVWLYETDHLKLAAAIGRADMFFALKDPKVHAQLDFADLPSHRFMWSDRNGDGQVQGVEVALTKDDRRRAGLTAFNRDLGAQMGTLRYQVKEFLPNGAPVYEEQHFPELPDAGDFVWYRLNNGNFHRMKNLGAKEPEGASDANGKLAWTYASEAPGVHGYTRGGPYHPGQVLGQFAIIGHGTAPAGDLGEFFLYSSNTGAWHLWTADGLLAARVFTDLRDRTSRHWSFPEHDRGLDLTGVSIGQEHFSGYFCRSLIDNKYYAVAGHNHASVVEVVGLDRFKRIGGTIEVSEADIAKTLAWERTQQRAAVYQRAPVVMAYRLSRPPRIDGALGDWPATPSAEIADAELDPIARFHVGFNDRTLFLAYQTYDLGPLANNGQQWRRLFKTGAAVDLQIAANPDAPADRRAPVAGDQRLLLTWVKKQAVAVLYQAVVPGTAPADAWQVVSPVNQVAFDRVEKLENVEMARQGGGRGYVVEAAIPLAALGLKVHDGMRVKLDWGMLTTDKSANQVRQRLYWANKATGIVADAPSEARLQPDLWGHVIFHNRDRDAAHREATANDALQEGSGNNKLFDDFMDELKDDQK